MPKHKIAKKNVDENFEHFRDFFEKVKIVGFLNDFKYFPNFHRDGNKLQYRVIVRDLTMPIPATRARELNQYSASWV